MEESKKLSVKRIELRAPGLSCLWSVTTELSPLDNHCTSQVLLAVTHLVATRFSGRGTGGLNLETRFDSQ